MQTKNAALSLASWVVLTASGFSEEPAPPKPDEPREAPKDKSGWTDYSWMTKWFNKSEEGRKPSPADPSTPPAATGIDVTSVDVKEWENWLKEQWNSAGQFTQETKDKLAKVEWDALKKQFIATWEALEKDDFAEAHKQALAIDATLGTHAMQEYVPLLKLWTEKGLEDASTAIKGHLNRPGISDAERKAYEGLIVSLEAMDRDDVKGYVSLGIVFACRHKFGGRQGELLGGLIVAGLYGEAGGSKGLVQWAKENLKGAMEKKPMP